MNSGFAIRKEYIYFSGMLMIGIFPYKFTNLLQMNFTTFTAGAVWVLITVIVAEAIGD